jgi:hypothetical protein
MYGTDRNIFSKDLVGYFGYWFGWVNISLEKSHLACFFGITISRSSFVSADALIYA